MNSTYIIALRANGTTLHTRLHLFTFRPFLYIHVLQVITITIFVCIDCASRTVLLTILALMKSQSSFGFASPSRRTRPPVPQGPKGLKSVICNAERPNIHICAIFKSNISSLHLSKDCVGILEHDLQPRPIVQVPSSHNHNATQLGSHDQRDVSANQQNQPTIPDLVGLG